jgi:predicted N-formylglutamate amidohydrolase
MAATPVRVIVTCEHGGKRIPPRYKPFFRGREAQLDSHEGYDAGALTLARRLAAALAAPLIASTTSRLLIDLNRSVGHPGLYSQALRAAGPAVRREILEAHYAPYRQAAEAEIAKATAAGRRVVHVSCHSFTPELRGKVRDADIGLLYDPRRAGEVEFCRRWRAALNALAPRLKVRRNYPYRGQADGFTSHLRQTVPADRYLGIEIEINQKHVLAGGRHWRSLREIVTQALQSALAAR